MKFTSAAKKTSVFVLCAAMLLLAVCPAFADGEIADGYKGLNAVEADKYFKEVVVPAKIKAAKENRAERFVWEKVEKLSFEVDTKLPDKKESDELHEKMLGNISGQLKPYAAEKYRKAVAEEPKITKDIVEAALSVGAGMYGLSHRLKSAGENEEGVCRIEDKIQKTIEDEKKAGNEITYEKAADAVTDLVRYTVACTPFGFYNEYRTVASKLIEKGYKPVKVKNTWESYTVERPYRGVNTVFMSPAGQLFEVQFHTVESYVAGQITHDIYEEARKPGVIGTKKADALNGLQFAIYDGLTKPEDVGRILNYPPKK